MQLLQLFVCHRCNKVIPRRYEKLKNCCTHFVLSYLSSLTLTFFKMKYSIIWLLLASNNQSENHSIVKFLTIQRHVIGQELTSQEMWTFMYIGWVIEGNTLWKAWGSGKKLNEWWHWKWDDDDDVFTQCMRTSIVSHYISSSSSNDYNNKSNSVWPESEPLHAIPQCSVAFKPPSLSHSPSQLFFLAVVKPGLKTESLTTVIQPYTQKLPFAALTQFETPY